MRVRPEVAALVLLGPLPPEDVNLSESTYARHQEALERISKPVSNEEARLLLRSFGPDDCFGAAWSLLHLIETAPVSPVTTEPGADDNEWIRCL